MVHNRECNVENDIRSSDELFEDVVEGVKRTVDDDDDSKMSGASFFQPPSQQHN